MITEKDSQALINLQSYAMAKPVSLEKLKIILATGIALVDSDGNYEARLGDGSRVVYTIEDQPMGRCHHISISHRTKKPSPKLVDAILGKLGFQKLSSQKNAVTYFESNKDFKGALNVIIPFSNMC